ncbi:hypothetical protein BWQ96_05867 [Gracilariopsis chorda]|uniref:BHLH domain-containing protein n=1 Tax=Gracilariopsis chorda TaxID=448386 RepID=A0A2V3IQR8_9FLOR|nr:hypothetical protein BWQ96_05867 [Gracilariopsis chorda]|eukprot:PXF44424.1 hypothetical protein BWQ96_05867 [Gracilariopsis chorda]
MYRRYRGAIDVIGSGGHPARPRAGRRRGAPLHTLSSRFLRISYPASVTEQFRSARKRHGPQRPPLREARLPSSPQTSPPSFDEDDDDASLPDQNEYEPSDDDSNNSDFQQQHHTPLPPQPQSTPTIITNNPENQSITSGHASPTQQRRNHHNTHTRRCRARLNGRFDTLNNILPRSPTVEVKHKVHILDHAITALQEMHQQNANLQLLLALRSRPRLVKWVDSFVPTASSIQQALDPFISLVCHTAAWPYAEVWHAQPPHINLIHTSPRATTMHFPALNHLAHVSAAQTQLCFADDFVGKCFETRVPRWSCSPVQQCQVAQRAQLLAAARIQCAFAVPIPVAGDVSHVVAFFDVRQRERDTTQVQFAAFAAVCVGNAWAAKQASALAS